MADRLGECDEVWLPLVVLAEIKAGFYGGSQQHRNEALLQSFLAGPLLESCFRRAKQRNIMRGCFVQLKRAGTPIPDNDLWIAALALEHDLQLITRDQALQAHSAIVASVIQRSAAGSGIVTLVFGVGSSCSYPLLSAKNWRSRLAHWTDGEALLQHEDKILLLLTLIIGALVGLVVAAFIYVTEDLGARMYPAGGAAWRRVLIPTGGALITGYLLSRFFPNARGSGIPQTKAALFLRDGFISLRTVLGKFGCCSASLASGIALGREGPSVQVGAGIASVLGRRLGLGPNRIRELIPVGAAAALAAAFNTPVAAVLFTLEEVMGDLHAPVLGSIVLGSATSWVTLHLLLGDEPLFHVPSYQLVSPIEFITYAVLGIAGGLVSVAFVKLLLGDSQILHGPAAIDGMVAAGRWAAWRWD